MFERGEYISFANCGLPYYIGGDIKDRSRLLVQTPEAMQSRFNLDVRINSEVTSINALRRTVTVRQSNGEEYEESFDALLLSPGAKPIKPSNSGIDSERIFTLRSLPDTDRIKSYIEDHHVKRAAVIGGGFIGIEMAENLIQRGIEVTIIEAAPHILAPFDSDMAVYAEQELEDKGARLALGESVESFEAVSNEVHIQLKSGRKIASDMVILAIGVTPDTNFLLESGIEFGARGHIVVNERMETNIQGIYAVGDAVEVNHFVLGNQTAIPLAGPANKQGRIAADNIAGLTSQYHGTQGTSILKIFGMTAAATGVNVRTLKQNGQTPHVAFVHPPSHATYYPGASSITLKLIFNDEGRILGAQAFGKEGVDKRIDVIATVMRLKGTVQDLSELELSYAPPFSSAKDPVNMAGYVAQNILDGRTDVWLSDELDDLEIPDTQLVDVRTEDEHSVGAIPGSINIPVDELRERLHELNPSKPVYTYCQVGQRGYIASQILTQNGFKVRNLSGGYKSYKANPFKTDSI
ncbi:FAD-dependent oxidoreductase [Paenibacillus sp. MY03]|uniref:FAD-dependent oxidoreductase n=1 Tax=Paenibacillus sp. MY03 TaxID=302980 RepID=UPI00277D13EF|nr:FAD-dependent oxidoreductase [Paenibacillus sp. MY03]